jgi:hypothetical protein
VFRTYERIVYQHREFEYKQQQLILPSNLDIFLRSLSGGFQLDKEESITSDPRVGTHAMNRRNFSKSVRFAAPASQTGAQTIHMARKPKQAIAIALQKITTRIPRNMNISRKKVIDSPVENPVALFYLPGGSCRTTRV